MANDPRFLLPFDQGLLALPAQNMLVIRPVDTFGLNDLPSDGLVLEQGFKPMHDALAGAGYSVVPRATGTFDLTIVNLTRSKVENLGNIARAARMTSGMVLVNGAKTDGIESTLRQVRKETEIAGVLSKSHGKVFWFEGSLPEAWEKAAEPSKNKAGFVTAAGMFSAEKVDAGSQRLAEHLSGLKGRGADLGSGWGWLAAQVLSQDITALELFEADFYALEAARKNTDDPRAMFHWVDVTTLPKTREPFDFVVSNPPFHVGRAADPDLGRAFIKAAAEMLKSGGRFLMVANRQLPYEATLEQYFRQWTPVFQDGQFKVFDASRPRKQ
ncbi:MAG: class I SAM-dependent methyltransferase [Rhodobacteraceae bacterium]|nr:class I SAM-dependent methyltransferase [Paracoccaceae bacterium]